MRSVSYCRKRARELTALAEREPQHKSKHLNAADAWLRLAKRIEEIEIKALIAIKHTKPKEPACAPTIAECLTQGEQHIAEAQRDPQHVSRHIDAALACFFLASRLTEMARQPVATRQSLGTRH
jgi:hypothetical protein